MLSIPKTLAMVVACLLMCCLWGCPNQGSQTRGTVPKELKPLLAYIAKERSKIKSIEGSAKLRIYKPNGRRRTLRLNYQIQRPNRIHLQIVAAAMQPVLIVTCDGKQFAVHNIIQKEFIRGPASRLPQLLGDFLPTHIPLAQLISALLGELPLLPATSRRMTKGDTPDKLTLTLKGADHEQIVWINAKKGQFLGTKVTSKKRPPLFLKYGTHRGTPPLPQRIQFIMPKKKRRVHWIFGGRDVNPKLTIKNFQQTPPKGVAIKTI